MGEIHFYIFSVALSAANHPVTRDYPQKIYLTIYKEVRHNYNLVGQVMDQTSQKSYIMFCVAASGSIYKPAHHWQEVSN